MERHIQTILTAVVTAILLWVGVSVTQTRESVARLDERVAALTLRMDIASELEAKYYDLDSRVRVLERSKE